MKQFRMKFEKKKNPVNFETFMQIPESFLFVNA